jgi:ribosome maturation factor RimP
VDGSTIGVTVAGGGAGAQACIERTVVGLGFDLVDVERSARGLLRVFIDRVPGHVYPESQGTGEFVTVDDCEAVTRQLQYVLEVEGVAYERLEVSSPGLDRPLKKPADFERFCGQAIELTLRLAFQGRKHQRVFIGAGADLDGRLGPSDQCLGRLGRLRAERQQQAVLSLRIERVGVESAAQQVRDRRVVIRLYGPEEIFIRAGMSP